MKPSNEFETKLVGTTAIIPCGVPKVITGKTPDGIAVGTREAILEKKKTHDRFSKTILTILEKFLRKQDNFKRTVEDIFLLKLWGKHHNGTPAEVPGGFRNLPK